MIQLDFFRRLWGASPKPPQAIAPASVAIVPPTKIPRAQVGSEKKQPRARIEPAAAVLESRARELLHELGVPALAERLSVRWNSRMRSTAGLAYPGKSLVVLNPRLAEFGEGEIERTLLHEVAHLLAHERAGRRRIAPHGPEWRRACHDLGLADEQRCHTLPLPRRQVARKHLYRCPGCGNQLRRVRPLRARAACLPCCRKHNRGAYDERFRFVKVKA